VTPTGALRSLAGAAALLLAGCAAPRGDTALPPTASPYAGAPPAQAAMFATELAGPDTYLPPLPTAVILLRPYDMDRNRALCRAALTLPTVQQAEAASVVAPNLIHTRWLVQIADVPVARATDCDFLTGTYDYARAARLMATIRPDTGSLLGRGPFLLMFIPDRAGLRVAGLDGSAVDATGMPAFIAGWGQALTQSQARIAATQPAPPGLVRSVFDLVGAILRTVGGATAGLITGTLDAV
jgi:hypothetical protein